MRMPGQSWADAALTFFGMWTVMMVAMMLPALTAQLWRYREAFGNLDNTRLNGLTALVGLGYFAVWSALGLAVFPIGAALATLAMQWPDLARAVPLVMGAIVVLAGAVQFSAWKARHLACCRARPAHAALPIDAASAWRYGVRLGRHCSYCCAGLTAILLVVGVMDLRAMAVVAAAIIVERMAPAGKRVARAIGAVTIAVGLFLIVHAGWFG
jgi:predicted metal-binding membrane protein